MNQSMGRLDALSTIPPFETKVSGTEFETTSDRLEVMQVNVGRKCNLACKHCHLEAGPNRTEEMSREVMEAVLTVCREQGVGTIDITGGAPEMNPNLAWFLEECCKCSQHVILRTNLVILTEEAYFGFADLYAKLGINVVCSLPYYRAKEMDRVRGNGSFEKAIEVIRKLNDLGYGRDPRLVLDMVYNPAGAYFPPDQGAMEALYKERLRRDFGIEFNHLFTITNNPIGRFGAFLERSGNLESYMQKLYGGFNPATLPGMMCRFQLSVGYDGRLYDCDFNQAADLPVEGEKTIFDLVGKPYAPRPIVFGKHCYACTAGAGSSCGGATE